jgi:hypothetical protein
MWISEERKGNHIGDISYCNVTIEIYIFEKRKLGLTCDRKYSVCLSHSICIFHKIIHSI